MIIRAMMHRTGRSSPGSNPGSLRGRLVGEHLRHVGDRIDVWHLGTRSVSAAKAHLNLAIQTLDLSIVPLWNDSGGRDAWSGNAHKLRS